jgi:hypothetical protein
LNPQSFIAKIFSFSFPTFPAMKHLIIFVLFLLAQRSPAQLAHQSPAPLAQRSPVPLAHRSPALARAASPILVTNFGAQPDSHKDATAAFQRAISACRKLANPVLLIPHGRYDLYPDSAIKKTYFISNTSSESECPSKVKSIGLLFEGIRNLRVEGDSSLLVFHGKMTTIVIDHCDNFTLSNLTEDFARPTMSEFTVTRAADTAIDVRVHPDSWHRIDSGRLTWYGEDWVAKDHFCIRVDTTHAFFYANDAYDQLLHSVVTEPSPGLLHFSGTFDRDRFTAGSVFTVRDPIRDEVGAFLVNSKNIQWKNISMRYMHGLGIVAQFSENISMEKVLIEPAAGSGRMIASFADGMHFSCCKGLISVDSCRFDGMHDDAINVHGVHLGIAGHPSLNTLSLRYLHSQTYGFTPCYPGDSIAFVRPQTLAIYRYAVVKTVQWISPRDFLVTLTGPVPKEVRLAKEGRPAEKGRTADVIENISWTPRVNIRHCHVAGTETRGFLITTRRKVIIEKNTFSRIGMSAILVADDGLSWYESGQVHDLTIRHNLFSECGNNLLPANFVISIAPENHQLSQTFVHSNIRITGNRFICYTPALLTARSVDGLVFSGNSIEQVPYFQTGAGGPGPSLPDAGKTPKAFVLTACRHVSIKNNSYLSGPLRR